jgi:hypothetical protein
LIQIYQLEPFYFDFKWSKDSDFILCSLNKRNIVQVFSLENPEWKCKIDEGSAGLIQVCWSPDSRHILTTSDFNVNGKKNFFFTFRVDFKTKTNPLKHKVADHSLVFDEQKRLLHEVSEKHSEM